MLSWDPSISQPQQPSYATFLSLNSQPLTTNSETIVSYTEKTLGSMDIILLSPTKIQYRQSGTYQFLYSIEVNKNPGGGTTADINVYIKIDGQPVVNSSSRTLITNSIAIVITCDYILSLKAGQVIEVAAYTTGTNVLFPYFAPIGTAPATPSVIITTQRI